MDDILVSIITVCQWEKQLLRQIFIEQYVLDIVPFLGFAR